MPVYNTKQTWKPNEDAIPDLLFKENATLAKIKKSTNVTSSFVVLLQHNSTRNITVVEEGVNVTKVNITSNNATNATKLIN